MSEERLTRIENSLEILVTGQAELRTDVTDLKTGQAELRDAVTDLQTGQEELRVGYLVLDRRLARVEIGQEDMRDHIKQIAEGHAAVVAAVNRGVEPVKEYVDRRITPLEQDMRDR